MNAIVYSLLAAGTMALANFFFRKNTLNDADRGANGYLTFFFLFSFLSFFVLFPGIWETKINWTILSIGACVGILNVLMMLFASWALQQGPSGPTFAFQNASAVFPGLLLFLFFGSAYGFSCSIFQVIGIGIVLLGLFFGAGGGSAHTKVSSKWLIFAAGCFLAQVIALTLIQGRCILFDEQNANGFLAKIVFNEAEDIWFIPGQFGMAFLLQSFIFLKERRVFTWGDFKFGSMAGIANFTGNVLLLTSTKIALPYEKGILFPAFAVATIILCNLWATFLYKEKFNFKSNTCCALGIFMGVIP